MQSTKEVAADLKVSRRTLYFASKALGIIPVQERVTGKAVSRYLYSDAQIAAIRGLISKPK